MRLGRRWASAAAATRATLGVEGFAAAPGAAPVSSGGGCRLRDDPPGHAEAAAAVARGECGAAQSWACWPSASGEGPGGSPLAGQTGSPAAATASPTSATLGPHLFLPVLPGRLEARGGRLGPALPRSPHPASIPARPGVWNMELTAALASFGLGPGTAQPLTPSPARTSRRESEDACLETASAFPRRRVSGGGAGGLGGNWSAESEGP